MKLCLLLRLPSIGTYKGAWMSGTIKRGEVIPETVKAQKGEGT